MIGKIIVFGIVVLVCVLSFFVGMSVNIASQAKIIIDYYDSYINDYCVCTLGIKPIDDSFLLGNRTNMTEFFNIK